VTCGFVRVSGKGDVDDDAAAIVGVFVEGMQGPWWGLWSELGPLVWALF